MPFGVKLVMLVMISMMGAHIPVRKTRRRDVFARKVREISVSSGIADCRNTASFASVEVVLGELKRSLQSEGVLNKCRDQPRGNVPFDMAVEQPNT
jgi:hypothetical protein